VQQEINNIKGEVIGKMELRDDVFNVPFNEAVVHQALVRALANRRLGTVDTQTRGDVTKSTKKLFAQKGTGRARGGSAKSPLLKGGGVVFGPHPRDYRQDMPKKMRRLAIKCVLSAKANDKRIKVVDKLEIEEAKTKEVFNILLSLKIGNSVLIATTSEDRNVVKAARNLLGVKTTPARLLNVADLLSYKELLMTKSAVQVVEDLWKLKEKNKAGANTT
jgi:large subunit ribosomal protein L4